MATNPKYNETVSYNKHLDCDFKSVSPCPPGLVAVYDCDGNHSSCLSPNDAEVYKNSTLKIAEGYAKVYHPVTGEYLGAMCVTEACELLACLNADFSIRDYVSGVVLTGNNLVFTATGDAFAGSVDLTSIISDTNDIDYVNAAALAGTVLNLTGLGNAGASVELASLVTVDTNDIDYINTAALAGSTLNLTGLGNAGASVDLSPLTGSAYDVKYYNIQFTDSIAAYDADQEDDTFTIAEAGEYLVEWTLSAKTDSYTSFKIQKNGVDIPGANQEIDQQTVDNIVPLHASYLTNGSPFAVSDVISVDVLQSSTGASAFTELRNRNFKIVKIG